MQTKYSTKKHYFKFIANLIFRHAQRDFETSSTFTFYKEEEEKGQVEEEEGEDKKNIVCLL